MKIMYLRLNMPGCFFYLLLLFPLSTYAEHDSGPSLSIGGRIKLDAIYNDNSIGGIRTSKSDLAFSPGAIPLPDNNKNSLDFNLRESRLWATLKLPISEQSLSTYVEFDFFDSKRDSAGRAHVANEPRLRHLYASFMNLTAGKTYTTFVNMAAYPEINDANGPVGVLSIRQELIRFNKQLSFGDVSIALENPESTFTSASGSSFQVNDDQVPDIIGKIELSGDWGNWSISAMAREINTDGKVINGVDKELWGGAISTAGRLFIKDQDNLRFTLSYGNALGRYMSYNIFNDAAMDNTGKTNLTEILAGYIAYQHWWNNTLRSSFIAGAAYANQDTSKVPSTVNKFFASSNVNLLWSPNLKTTVGVEWLHGYRERENGNNAHLNRIQFSAVYKF